MGSDVSDEELAAALAAAVDEDGNDVRRAAWIASWSEEQRQASEENLRRSIAEARATLRRPREPR